MRIDAHQHFWRFEPEHYGWIDSNMDAIRKDFLPAQLKPVLDRQGIAGSVAVQAVESYDETDFLLELASINPWVRKVVGWIDFSSPDALSEVERRSDEPRLAGFRQVIQSQPPAVMSTAAFRKGMSALQSYDFTFDLLLYPRHLAAAKQLVRQFPDQKFVIDHLAKPPIADGMCTHWYDDIREIARSENVYCKLSGMVTEAQWRAWAYDQFTPFMDCVFESFGSERLMYGSDWPVSLLAADPDEVIGIVQSYLGASDIDQMDQVFGLTACDFYGIDPS